MSTPPVKPPALDSMDAVKAFIDRHHASRIVMLDVAGRAGLSQVQFLRAFSRAFGTPPLRYLIAQRVARAGVLLLHGVSPARAASAVGFCDQSHMIRHFRRVLGVTPGEFVESRCGEDSLPEPRVRLRRRLLQQRRDRRWNLQHAARAQLDASRQSHRRPPCQLAVHDERREVGPDR